MNISHISMCFSFSFLCNLLLWISNISFLPATSELNLFYCWCLFSIIDTPCPSGTVRKADDNLWLIYVRTFLSTNRSEITIDSSLLMPLVLLIIIYICLLNALVKWTFNNQSEEVKVDIEDDIAMTLFILDFYRIRFPL